MHVAMLLYPRMTQLDLTGPYEVFARFPELKLHLVAKTSEPIADVSGLRILPNATFADCPPCDILFVPGGPGQAALMEDGETLAFLRRQAGGATYITSVCTGSLVLAAAGLLTGYKATCHWLSIDQLAHFGVEPTRQRVVVDRDRITGGGVTSGIDFALVLMARIFGAERAEFAQLFLEYDPEPPFGGSPAKARPEVLEKARSATADFQRTRDEIARRAAAALRGAGPPG